MGLGFWGPSPTLAQPDDGDALFEEAMRLYEQGDFREATARFEDLVRVDPFPAACFNLNSSRAGLGEYVQARNGFDQMLDGACGSLTESQRADIQAERAAVEARISRVELQVAGVDAADVSIDGQPRIRVRRGEPLAVELNSGPHVVEATAPRHGPIEHAIELDSGEARVLSLELRPDREPGVLTLVCDDELAELELVGIATGIGRIVETVPPGRYEGIARASGDTTSSEVEVPPGEEVTLRLPAPGESLFQSPWFWVVGGSILVLLAGAAIAIGVAATTDRQPESSPIWGLPSPLGTP
ncbi:MAG: hypothetical protein AAGF12_00035 [Myxococcota bacterium]